MRRVQLKPYCYVGYTLEPLESWISDYGLWALFVASLLEGETALLAAGFLAYRGHLSLPSAILVAIVAAMVADGVAYALGRIWGKRWLARVDPSGRYREKIVGYFNRYGKGSIYVVRYFYGLRTTAAVFFAMFGLRARTYLLHNALACVIWGLVVGGLGYLFGRSLGAFFERLPHYELWIAGGVVAMGLVGWLLWLRRRKQRTHTKLVLRSGPQERPEVSEAVVTESSDTEAAEPVRESSR